MVPHRAAQRHLTNPEHVPTHHILTRGQELNSLASLLTATHKLSTSEQAKCA